MTLRDSPGFFGGFVFRQRAVRESKASDGTLFIDHIDNLATVKRPKSKMPDHYGNSFPGLNSRSGSVELNARHIEHFPSTQGLYRPVECCGSFA